MKLPGDSDNMDKGVSHEMMQRSLQSQRRVVKRVGLLEDKVSELEKVEERVDDIESAEIELRLQAVIFVVSGSTILKFNRS